MDYMFFECQELRKLELSNFETSNLTDEYQIFGEDHIDYPYIRNFSLKNPYNEYNFFQIGYICKLTSESSFHWSNIL